MNQPENLSLPFLAYGVFKPGQLSFLQIADCVAGIRPDLRIPGQLRLRDGLPLFDPEGAGQFVRGSLIAFEEGKTELAYLRIAGLEPHHQYSWRVMKIGENDANVLIGRSPKKGSSPCDEEWDGWTDPFFGPALEVVEETLRSNQEFDWDLKPLFRLQMAYLLLWSSIERYASLRYGFGDEPMPKIKQLATETAFITGLSQNVSEKRVVLRADDFKNKRSLDPSYPDKSIQYYYQVRANVTHRGKSVPVDHETVLESLSELLPIFRGMLAAARKESEAIIREATVMEKLPS
jgi:hypothetical protein